MEWSYAEGADNGPPLLLLHAQHMEWFSYSRVFPSLAERFRVIAVDCPGHGKTVVPQQYPMTANRIGADLAALRRRSAGPRMSAGTPLAEGSPRGWPRIAQKPSVRRSADTS